MPESLSKKIQMISTPPVWVDTLPKLQNLIETLSGEAMISVDTESDSLYSYFEKVCLIQISTLQADYLIDPLAVDVSTLADTFANPAIQKIFHAAEYDILSLKRDYDFTFVNLFDTMIAARILGWPRYGLGAILAENFGVNLDKRFQRYNWGKRPLSTAALNYARLDTHYLFSLRQLQQEQLVYHRQEREAYEAFERQTQLCPSPKTFNPNDFWRVKGSRDLTPPQQAILRELFVLRDKIARKIDRPPFKVLNDSVMIELATIQPESIEELKPIKGLGKQLFKYNSQELLKAISRGQNALPPRYQPRKNHRPDDATLQRYETLRRWRNKLALKRGVEPDVIISNGTLMHIARYNPQNFRALTAINKLGDWQREKYGQALLKVLNKMS